MNDGARAAGYPNSQKLCESVDLRNGSVADAYPFLKSEIALIEHRAS
jgi:hypothetical protein